MQSDLLDAGKEGRCVNLGRGRRPPWHDDDGRQRQATTTAFMLPVERRLEDSGVGGDEGDDR